MSLKTINNIIIISVLAALAGCSPSSNSFKDISYPDDTQIAKALDAQLLSDPNSAAARALVHSMGGAEGKLKYKIQHVIYRQSAYEVHYDAALVMGQSGAQSLQSLYESMIPEEERKQLPEATLPAYRDWLNAQANALEKQAEKKVQGQVLRNTIAMLDKCYAEVTPGTEVVVLQGLGALLLPERNGLYAEKIQMPNTSAQCLPL